MTRCKICGHQGDAIRPGLYRTRAGRYVVIPRCVDHLACEDRRAAL